MCAFECESWPQLYDAVAANRCINKRLMYLKCGGEVNPITALMLLQNQLSLARLAVAVSNVIESPPVGVASYVFNDMHKKHPLLPRYVRAACCHWYPDSLIFQRALRLGYYKRGEFVCRTPPSELPSMDVERMLDDVPADCQYRDEQLPASLDEIMSAEMLLRNPRRVSSRTFDLACILNRLTPNHQQRPGIAVWSSRCVTRFRLALQKKFRNKKAMFERIATEIKDKLSVHGLVSSAALDTKPY